MSNSHSAAATAAETPEKLIEHINHLMDEAEAMLSGPISEQASNKISQMQSRLERVQGQLSDAYEVTRRKITDGARYTDKTIRKHPYESIAVALGVGVVVGLLVGRNRN